MSQDFTVVGLVSDRPIDAKAILKMVAELGRDIQLVDASKVYGKEHLELAAEKAVRAYEEGRMFGKTLAVEVLLYASGKRQISEAIKFMGIKDGMKEFGAVVLGKMDFDIKESLGMRRDDKVLEGSDDVLKAFGIGPEALKGVPKERRGDLVLERVAMLELEK